jgi:hypothetical protein
LHKSEFGQRNTRKPFGFGRFHRFAGLNEFLCPNYISAISSEFGPNKIEIFLTVPQRVTSFRGKDEVVTANFKN